MSHKKKNTFSRTDSGDELIEDYTFNPYEVNESFRRGLQIQGQEYLEKIEKLVMKEKDINQNRHNFIKFFDNIHRKVHRGNSGNSNGNGNGTGSDLNSLDLLTEGERFGLDTETLLRLGTIVIESSPNRQQLQRHNSHHHSSSFRDNSDGLSSDDLQIARGVSDRSDDRYADDDFEEYLGDEGEGDDEGDEEDDDDDDDDERRDEVVEEPVIKKNEHHRAHTAQTIPSSHEITPLIPKKPRSMSAPISSGTLEPLHFPDPNETNKSQLKFSHRQAGWIKRGEWRIGSKIGSGSFGDVYQGMSDDGHLFAVKKMNIVPDKEISNLASEIELMRVLDHPNIVKYLGVKVTRS
jgi:hypothetical protein